MHEKKNIVETGFKLNSQETSHVTREETPFYKNTDKTFQGTIIKPGETLTNSIPASSLKKQQQGNSADHKIVCQVLKQEENSATRTGDVKISKKTGVNTQLMELKQEVEKGHNSPETTSTPVETNGFITLTEEITRSKDNRKEENKIRIKMDEKIANKICRANMKPPNPHPTTLLNHHFKENQDPRLALTPPIPPIAPTTSQPTRSTPQPKWTTGTTTTSKSPSTPKQRSGETHKGVDKKKITHGVGRSKTIARSIIQNKIKKLKRYEERAQKRRKKKAWGVIPKITSQSKNNLEKSGSFQVKHQNKEGTNFSSLEPPIPLTPLMKTQATSQTTLSTRQFKDTQESTRISFPLSHPKNNTTRTQREDLIQENGEIMASTEWVNKTVLGRGRPPENIKTQDQPRKPEERF